MRLKTENRIIGVHPLAVVNDRDQLFPRFPYRHCDPERSRIQRIFKEFLQYRSRTLHHLARGDFIVNLFRQKLYLAHLSACDP